jgi:16S rRNA processing protein RimM
VGEIRKAHGIKGECFVVLATDDVAGVYARGRALRVGDSEGRPGDFGLSLTVLATREFKGGLIVRFEGVRDRSAAEVLRGRTLLIAWEDVRPLEAGEYFLHDLIGLEVQLLDGTAVGRVVEVYETGPGCFLSVDDGESERIIPFAGRIIREVDVAAGRIVIEPVPGLLDL